MRSGVVTKEAATLLTVHRNSTSRRLERLIVPARLMAADLGKFLILIPPYLRGAESLSSRLALWPESRILCKYGHIGWDQFIAAVAPAFETFKTLWTEDQTTTFETMAPYVTKAIEEQMK